MEGPDDNADEQGHEDDGDAPVPGQAVEPVHDVGEEFADGGEPAIEHDEGALAFDGFEALVFFGAEEDFVFLGDVGAWGEVDGRKRDGGFDREVGGGGFEGGEFVLAVIDEEA